MGTDAVLGLDIGSTHIKAAVFDLAGRPLAVRLTATPLDRGYASPVRHPESVSAACRNTVRAVVADARRRGAGVKAMAVASVGEEGILLDAAGRPLAPVVPWFVHCPAPGPDTGTFRLRTGLKPKATYALYKWLAFKDAEPGLWRQARLWLPWSEYITWQLTGIAVLSLSQASRTGAWNLREKRWEQDWLDSALPIGGAALPPVVPGGTVVGRIGKTGEDWGLPPGTVIAAGGHDHPLGAVGAGLTAPEDILDSMGTSEVVFRPLPQLPARELPEEVAAGAGGSPAPYYLAFSLYSGMGTALWSRLLQLDNAAALDRAAAASPPGANGVRARTAGASGTLRFTLEGISPGTSPADVARAVLEAEALMLVRAWDILGGLAAPAPRRLVVIGGGSRSGEALRIRATLLDRPLEVIEGMEVVARGAAALAARALGAAFGAAPAATVDPVPAWIAAYDTMRENPSAADARDIPR